MWPKRTFSMAAMDFLRFVIFFVLVIVQSVFSQELFYRNSTHRCDFTLQNLDIAVLQCRTESLRSVERILDNQDSYNSWLINTCADLNAANVSTAVLCYGAGTDLITDNLYFIHSRANELRLVTDAEDPKEDQIRVPVNAPSSTFRDVKVESKSRLLFWTEGGNNPRVMRSSITGQNKVVLSTDVLSPNGLAVSADLAKIAWADTARGVVTVCNFDGLQCSIPIRKSNSYFYIVAFAQDVVYVTDLADNSIKWANLTSGDRGTFLTEGIPLMMGTYEDEAPTNDTCPSTTPCQDVCIPGLTGKEECLCSSGKLNAASQTCDEGTGPFLVVADPETDTTSMYQISYNEPANIKRLSHTIDMFAGPLAVAHHGNNIYWTSTISPYNGIYRASITGGSSELLVNSSAVNPDGLAIDWISENMYWTDAWLKTITVSRLDGSSDRVLVREGLELPRGIAVDPLSGNMFWTDWGKNAKIERSSMDGTSRTTIISTDVAWPNALTIDYQSHRIFWADAWLRKIEMMNYDGLDRQVVADLNYIAHPFGLTIVESNLVWTDWYSKQIHTSKLDGTNLRTIGPSGMRKPSGITVLKSGPPAAGSNQCGANNGGCSNLCLPTPTGSVCQCPEGKGLKSGDGKTCEGVAQCPDLKLSDHVAFDGYCSVYEDTVCKFKCDQGYTMKGVSNIICLPSGSWSALEPTCEVVQCPEVPLAPNVQNSCGRGSQDYQTRCSLSCDQGYLPTTGVRTTCQADGTWDNNMNCSIVHCPALIQPTLGEFSSPSCTEDPTYGDTCTLKCPTGYIIEGPAQAVCLATGAWSTSATAKCKDVQGPSFGTTCPGDISVISDAGLTTATFNWTAYDIKATDNSQQSPSVTEQGKLDAYSEGSHTVRYTAKDQAGNEGVCNIQITVEVPRCPSPPPPSNGQFNSTCDTVHGSECDVTCDNGYILKRNNTNKLVCRYDTVSKAVMWEGTPECQVTTCPALDTSRGYTYKGCDLDKELPVNTVCELGCDIVYHRSENASVPTIKCLETGEWSPTEFECIPPLCGPLTAPVDGIVTPEHCTNQSGYKDVCKFSCNEGYRMAGEEERACTETSLWSPNDNTPTCTDVTPPDFGDTCPEEDMEFFTMACTSRTKVNWTEPSVADNSGDFDLTKPTYTSPSVLDAGSYPLVYTAKDKANNQKTCRFTVHVRAPTCPSLGNIPGGEITTVTCESQYGSVATYKCLKGYTMDGDGTLQCGKDGRWSGKVACKAIECPALPVVPNGKMSLEQCTSNKVFYGTRCDVTCDFGYELKGVKRYVCGNDGQWSVIPGQNRCKAIPPPSFGLTCPQSMSIIRNDPGKDYATARWALPRAVDSKGNTLRVQVTPANALPGSRFPIGSIDVTYTARDAIGLTSTCTFTIRVIDKDPPTALNCNKQQAFTASSKNTFITYDKPVFVDNVKVIKQTCSRDHGYFPFGTHKITCSARDAANNIGTCEMEIRVVPRSCPEFSSPVGGATACSQVGFATLCTLHCEKNKYFFPTVPHAAYTCTLDGKPDWIPRIPFGGFMCADFGLPPVADVQGRLEFHQFEGDCSKADIYNDISRKFRVLLTKSLFREVCVNDLCQISKVSITCAYTGGGDDYEEYEYDDDDYGNYGRRKREAPVYSSFMIDFVIRGNVTNQNVTNSTVLELQTTMNNVKDKIVDLVKSNNFTLELNSTKVTAHPKKVTVRTVERCTAGSVKREKYCVKCPAGTRYEAKTLDCIECPVGHYQDQEGQSECIPCPADTTTSDVGTYNASLCKAIDKSAQPIYLGDIPVDKPWFIGGLTGSAFIILCAVILNAVYSYRATRSRKAH